MPVSCSASPSAKMGRVTAETSCSVRPVMRSRSLVTGTPVSLARAAARIAASWSTSSTWTSRAWSSTSSVSSPASSRSRSSRFQSTDLSPVRSSSRMIACWFGAARPRPPPRSRHGGPAPRGSGARSRRLPWPDVHGAQSPAPYKRPGWLPSARRSSTARGGFASSTTSRRARGTRAGRRRSRPSWRRHRSRRTPARRATGAETGWRWDRAFDARGDDRGSRDSQPLARLMSSGGAAAEAVRR